MIIKRVDPVSVGKIAAVLYGGMGLIFGAVFALISLIASGVGAASGQAGPPFLKAAFGVGAIVIMPVLYGVMGAVMGMLVSLFYNFIAGFVGGIEIETE